MTSITIPDYGTKGRRVVPIVLVAVLLLAAAGWGAKWFLTRGKTSIVSGSFYTVAPIDLVVSVKKDGDLQAVNNIDINCEVDEQGTIQTIVKEGTHVKKGEVMATLDSSEINKKLQEAKVTLEKCKAELKTAEEEKTIQEAKNLADLEAAQVEKILADLDLAEYRDGKYPESLKEAQRDVTMSEISLKDKEEELQQTVSLYLKGFKELAEKKKAEVEVLQAQNDHDKKVNDLKILTDYTYKKEITDRESKVKQAVRKLARTDKENASSLAQKVADIAAKDEAFRSQTDLVDHLNKQFAACTIKAPSAGMVVYGSSGQSWYYRDRPIQAGAQIRQQELLIRLPDTSKMKAVVNIPEAWINKLKMDEKHPLTAMVDIVGQTKRFTGKVTSISVMADNSQRWWNPDAKDYPVDVTLDETPAGLKPGVSASVEIAVDRLPHVLAVPLSCVYSVGADRYIFVKQGSGVKPEKVTLGQSNDTHVEVNGGLAEGQDVLLLQIGQGRELLEKAGIKTTAATSQPSGAGVSPPVAIAR